MGKKKFIDKKKSATFALLYRVSGDGQELGDERVYTRVDNNHDIELPEFEGDSRFDDPDEDADDPRQRDEKSEQLRKELLELGLPDDGYNYMKHLRTMETSGSTMLVPTIRKEAPVDVKTFDASRLRVQESVSEKDVKFLKAKQIQSRSVNPEVTAALEDSDLEEESDLEDDFMLLANQDEDGDCSNSAAEGVDSDFELIPAEEDEEDVQPAGKVSEDRSVRLLDEQFEVLAMKEYDEDESEDDDPQVRGPADMSQFESIFDDFLAANPVLCGRPAPKSEKRAAEGGEPVHARTERETDEVISEAEEEVEAVWVDGSDDGGRETWDCETIVSTMTNLDNHPSRIGCPRSNKRVQFASIATSAERTIRLGGKQKLPLDFVKTAHGEPVKPASASAPASASRGETREERKAHKAAVKEDRRASRKAKKELKTEFKKASQKAQVGAAVVAPRAIHLS